MIEQVVLYTNFLINFLVIFALLIDILLLIACVFKSKEYAFELVLLGMISFCVFLGVHQFMNLTISSYELAGAEAPMGDMIISEMFSLMASMLVFGVAVTRKRLQHVKLGIIK